MKSISLLGILLLWANVLFGQNEEQPLRFYLGASYGTSYALADFKDTDRTNPDAGFAKDGQKIDIYGGFPLNEKFTFVGTFRYQSFETEVEDLIKEFNAETPGVEFTGNTENWQTYYLLAGVFYRIQASKKINFFPRVAIGPLMANNPGLSVSASDGSTTRNFSRSSETGFGLGYELGIGMKNDLGKHFSLMPTFTFGGGYVHIPDVVTTNDNITIKSDYEPVIQSFNLGLSVAYRFY